MMKEERFQSLMAGQSTIARKVYSAIPKIEAWSVSQIRQELSRLGISIEHRTVDGAIHQLVEAKLVTAIPGDRYRCLPVKLKSQTVKSFEEVPEIMKQEPTPPAAPAAPAVPVVQTPAVDRLIHLADALSTTGKMLITMSTDLTDIADSISRTNDADQANLQRLRQLQDLLRGIGMATTA